MHGTWYGKQELPAGPGGVRLTLRAGGFSTKDQLTGWFDRALALLRIPDPGPAGHADRAALLAAIRDSRQAGGDLPDYDETRRRYQASIGYEDCTAGEYLLAWIERRKAAHDGSPNTLRGYESHIRRILVPRIGDIPLSRLRPGDIEGCLNGKLPGDPGPVTRQRYWATARTALADAVRRDRLIPANPAAGQVIRLPSARGAKPQVWTKAAETAWRKAHAERLAAAGYLTRAQQFALWRRLEHRPSPVMVWTPAHAAAYLDFIAGDRLYPAVFLVISRGLRRAEVCGLRWPQVDLDERLLAIRGTRVQMGWQVLDSGEGKTEGSSAVLPLGPATEVLRAWRAVQEAEARDWGDAWAGTDYVFTSEDGKPYHPAQITMRFERLAWAADLPPVRFHDLRHLAASLAHRSGADMRDVQHLLRHTSRSLVTTTYTHVFQEAEEELATSMMDLLPRREVHDRETEGRPAVPDGPPQQHHRPALKVIRDQP